MTETGDTLRSKEKPLTLAPLEFPAPSLVLAIEPASKGDLDKMGPALQRMLEEEPTVRLERTTLGEQVLRTMGEAHIVGHHRAAQAQVRGRDRDPHAQGPVQGDDPRQDPGPRPLQEADRRPRHVRRRVAGARAQPGRRRRVRRADRRRIGAEGLLRRRREGHPRGGRRGRRRGLSRCRDFKATLYDGSFHPVDSNELSFKIAASMALKDGVHQAKPALMEPIMTVEIRVPEAYMGEVNRDLNGRRGRVLGMDTERRRPRSSRAHVPEAELFTYATELRSLTHGRGHVLGTLDHYEDVPSHIADKVIDAHRKEVEAAGGHGSGH